MTVMATRELTSPAAAQGLDDNGPNQWRAIHAEWVKLRTLRSTAFTLIAAIIGMAGIGLLISAVTNANWSHMQPDELARFDAVGRSLAGVNIAQLAVGVLGVLLVTGEYGTGMIRSTFAAIPARLPVIWAKSAVYAAITLAIMVPSAFIAFLGGQALLGTHGVSLSAPGAVRAVFGVALYLTVIGVLAGAIGFIVRSTAGGIASLFGLLLVLPGLGNLLPTSWQTNVLPYLPSRAGSALYDLRPDAGTLAPWTGFGVLCLWTVVALAIAAVLVRSRDV
ncbi:ABC transporter permease subunit [Acidothermaceae bacterium B102]|nr:ABC transporter permease subunit [Acidothermaceae bacterium B102]